MATFIVDSYAELKALLDVKTSGLSTMHLFVNDFTPGRFGWDASNFTEPATDTGYAPLACDSGWSAADTDAAGIAFSDHASFVFDVTTAFGADVVYGWFIKTAGGVAVCAQRGDGPGFPFPFSRVGDRVIVTARLTQESYGPPDPPAPSF